MSANGAGSANKQSSSIGDELVFRGVSSSAKHKNSDYFLKPADIERRRRQEEHESEIRQRKLRREANKKQTAASVETIDQDAAAKNVARSEKRQLRKLAHEQNRVRFQSSVGSASNRFKDFIKATFSGKKVFIYLALLGVIVLVAFNTVLYRKVIIPGREKAEDDYYAEYLEKFRMSEIAVNNKWMEMEMDSVDHGEILNYLDSERKAYKEDEPLYFLISLQYGEVLCRKDGYDNCISFFQSINHLAKYDYEKELLYYKLYKQYSAKRDYARSDEYADKFNSLKRRAVEENVKYSKELSQ